MTGDHAPAAPFIVRGSPPAAEVEAFVIRDAARADVPGIARLLHDFAERGLLLPRTEAELYDAYTEFGVCEHDGALVGTGALHPYPPAFGEIRSLAVREGCQRHGLGARLAQWGEARAHDLGLPRVFVLTYRVRFFQRLGYRRLPRAHLPDKVWGDCFRCPKAEFCDEIALAKALPSAPGVL